MRDKRQARAEIVNANGFAIEEIENSRITAAAATAAEAAAKRTRDRTN